MGKPPSADLWAGQTDEKELGISYELLDQILYLLIDLRCPITEIIAKGFDERLVKQVEQKIVASQFKRVLPPIAKLSLRTVGTDFLYPRDWQR